MDLLTLVSTVSDQDRQSRKGIFYDPKTSADGTFNTVQAVVSDHRKEPKGYLLFCDCSRLGDGSPLDQVERHSH